MKTLNITVSDEVYQNYLSLDDVSKQLIVTELNDFLETTTQKYNPNLPKKSREEIAKEFTEFCLKNAVYANGTKEPITDDNVAERFDELLTKYPINSPYKFNRDEANER